MCISVWEIVADNGGVTLKLFLVLTAPHSLRSIADVNDFITRSLARNIFNLIVLGHALCSVKASA